MKVNGIIKLIEKTGGITLDKKVATDNISTPAKKD